MCCIFFRSWIMKIIEFSAVPKRWMMNGILCSCARLQYVIIRCLLFNRMLLENLIKLIYGIILITCSGYFICKMAAFKNCDNLISPKWAAGEPKLWNSGCTQQKGVYTLKGLGAKVAVREECAYVWNKISECTAMSTHWRTNCSATNGKYREWLLLVFLRVRLLHCVRNDVFYWMPL